MNDERALRDERPEVRDPESAQPDNRGRDYSDRGQTDYQRQDPEYQAAAPQAAPAAPTSTRQQELEPGMESAPTTTMERRPNGQTTTAPSQTQATSGLVHDQKLEYFAGRWDAIQAGFVDDPRRTVEQADRLVAEVIDHLSKLFTEERAQLESQWSKSGKVETEDLRIAIQRYRDFFRTLIGR